MIKLDDALGGVQRLGLDTAPFIYFLERNPAYVNVVREVVSGTVVHVLKTPS